jgi:bacterioferritin
MMSLQTLIDALNAQLSAEYQAVVQYTHYSAVVSGPYRPELVRFFQTEIPDEQGHAQYLANTVALLGGTPTTTVLPVPAATDPRDMLQNIFEAESQAVEAYKKLVVLADAEGQTGLRLHLETFIQDESNHRDETRRLLGGKW